MKEEIKVVSENSNHRQIIMITEDDAGKKTSRTVHQTKVNGNWQGTTRQGRGWIKPAHVKASEARKKVAKEAEEE